MMCLVVPLYPPGGGRRPRRNAGSVACKRGPQSSATTWRRRFFREEFDSGSYRDCSSQGSRIILFPEVYAFFIGCFWSSPEGLGGPGATPGYPLRTGSAPRTGRTYPWRSGRQFYLDRNSFPAALCSRSIAAQRRVARYVVCRILSSAAELKTPSPAPSVPRLSRVSRRRTPASGRATRPFSMRLPAKRPAAMHTFEINRLAGRRCAAARGCTGSRR